jgi:phosphohistidine phosphatase
MIAAELGYNETLINTDPKIYLESKSRLIKSINKIDDRFNTVYLVSHNPGLTDLANGLTGESIDNIPTAGVVVIQFEGNSWSEVEKGKGKKIFFETPKAHRNKVEKTEKQVL